MISPNLKVSLAPVVLLLLFLVLNIILFKEDASYGPNQLALLFCAMFSIGISRVLYKTDYRSVEKKVIASIEVSMQACLILLFVGSLIALWIMAGIVPSMIYYGLKIISPQVFLPVSTLTCAIVSLSTGSSWSTTGTVGIALIAIGSALGIPEGLVAGAIISGAYFGDKMSPLSDTTNLAPAVAGTTLTAHVRHMVYTSVPAFILAIVLFAIIGLFYQGKQIDDHELDVIFSILNKNFNITLWTLIPPGIVFLLVAKKFPAIPSLLAGVLLGIVFILLFQFQSLEGMTAGSIYKKIITVSYAGFKIESGSDFIDKLLGRGGMSSMLNTIWLIISAMVFGGALEATGMLKTISLALLRRVKTKSGLVASTLGSCLFVNLTASDQYLAIVVPGRIFKEPYKDFKLAPENLSRALEDAGTVTSVLIPWNSCGAYNAAILGVATLTYAPFAFFNILSPIISLVIAISGKTLTPLEQREE